MAARASGLNQSISLPPVAAASWLPRTPIAPRVVSRSTTASGSRPVADDVAEVPDRVDRPDRRRGRRRARAGCCGCPRRTAIRMDVQSSSASLTMAGACARRGRADSRPGRRRGRSRRPGGGRRGRGDADRHGPRASRRRARRSPVPRRPARARGRRASRRRDSRPARAAGRRARRARRGCATARAVTAGQRPRWRRSAARASARTGAASTVPSRPVAATTADRKRGLLARSARAAAPEPPGARPRAAGPGSRRPTRGR